VSAGKHFDSIWLIQNELSRIGKSFFANPFTIYWKTFGDGESLPPLEVAKRLTGKIFTPEDFSVIKRFKELTMNGYEKGKEIEITKQIVEVMDEFYLALDKLVRTINK